MTDIGRSRRIWRRSFFILLGVSVVLISFLLIARSDRKVSYAGESRDETELSLEILGHVLEQQQPPPTRSGVLKILRHDNPRARILATNTTVTIGTLNFYFAKNGRLERVTAGK